MTPRASCGWHSLWPIECHTLPAPHSHSLPPPRSNIAYLILHTNTSQTTFQARTSDRAALEQEWFHPNQAQNSTHTIFSSFHDYTPTSAPLQYYEIFFPAVESASLFSILHQKHSKKRLLSASRKDICTRFVRPCCAKRASIISCIKQIPDELRDIWQTSNC
jgi:hypothetical protein